MKKKIEISKWTIGLSVLAAVCFFAAYILHGETIEFILGCAWVCIFLGQLEKCRKNRR